MSTKKVAKAKKLTTEEAFVRAKSHTFRGKALQPFSFHRQLAALRVITVLGMGQGSETKLLDPVIAVWLCSIPNSGEGWTVRRALAEPELALDKVIEFADSNGIGMGSVGFMEVLQITDAMLEEIRVSKGSPVVPGQGEGKDLGEL